MAKTGLIIVLVIVAVLVIGGVLLLTPKEETGTGRGGEVGGGAGSSGGGASGGEISNGQAGENGGEEGEIPTPQTYNVKIENFAFSPGTLRIKKGDKVIWTNFDSARHTATSDTGSELGSLLLSEGQTYSHTFNLQEEYEYHCTPHPYMKAKVIVE